MAIVIVKDKLFLEDFQKAKEYYPGYIKITICLEKELIALGGEYHVDAEKLLLEKGCQQKNIWGGGLNLETNTVETNALINLRPGENESFEILDSKKRKKFIKIARRILKNYVL